MYYDDNRDDWQLHVARIIKTEAIVTTTIVQCPNHVWCSQGKKSFLKDFKVAGKKCITTVKHQIK